jgi:predicted nuclease of predicted toxin-antitoxin system
MRFKIDENLHPDVAESLCHKGHDALGVWDQGLRGKRDEDLARVCRLEGRALLTLDVGFADIRTYPPDQYPGLIVLRLSHQSRRHVMTLLPRLLELLEAEPLAGCLWIIDEHSLRVRRGQGEQRE